MYTYNDLYVHVNGEMEDMVVNLGRLQKRGWTFHWMEGWMLATKEGHASVMIVGVS